ncbi:cadherin-related family member 2-like isoform X1 [Acipenser ruthenus]|uniref:cadherin-related family member 2-like isoform X1 n=2 Tax=Acipenser ruthenus TaxID=7906 RepID=UPI0027422A07|nr:cadherin-related family member 2-like isoform X1 [Acipenser ruthenus]
MRSTALLVLLLPCFFGTVSGNFAPAFCANMTYIELREDLNISQHAFWICAVDYENEALKYSMTGQNANFFNVAEETGEVKIKSPLDREIQARFTVMLGVKDSTNDIVTKSITIILVDANDNRPIFINAPYNEDVNENVAEGTVLFQVTATDADENSFVTYSIDEVVPDNAENHDLFVIERNGDLKLNGTLNYNDKSTYYQLKIKATDNGGLLYGHFVYQSSLAYGFINVKDAPDRNPVFLNTPYQTSVEENTPVGQSVFTVKAIDGDKGINDLIFYSIDASNVDGKFAINTLTGQISVNETIDREQLLEINAEVELVVTATEKENNIDGQPAKTSTTVTIRITDLNDNKPEFYNCMGECDYNSDKQDSFTGYIEEHSSTGVSVANLTIVARDPDEGTNARFVLTLQGPDAKAFSVAPKNVLGSSQVQIQVLIPNDVDYEKQHTMSVEIVANDTGRGADCCSTASVTIHLIDMNDNRPTFQNETYQLQVKEESAAGTVIATITASDPDTEDKDKITYRLLPDSILEFFAVGEKTGVITVKTSGNLDRETRLVYFATLQATDTANNIGTTVLEINLLDINDQTPKMVRDSYMVFVKEGPDGKLDLTIEAFDNDEPGTNNSVVRYKIEDSEFSNNFIIDEETGVVTINGTLDREAIEPLLNGKIQLTVTAYDWGHPILSSSVNVTINVEDINDNNPVFTQTVYQDSVRESDKGAYVGFVQATDQDQTEIHNRISYRITDGSFGNFIIRTFQSNEGYRGNVTVDPDIELDYEKNKKFTLIIEASDLGQNSATTTMEVTVLDVNDERPTLDVQSLTDVNVKENRSTSGVVRNITGTDADTNHSLVYELLEVTCECNKDVPESECLDWFWLSPDGSVTVNDSSEIDYEACHYVKMEVQVVDTFTEKGQNHSTSGILIINIVDINDNPPEFISNEKLFVVVPEVDGKDTEVATVSASDRDSGQNKVITFAVQQVEFITSDGSTTTLSGIFKVETTVENGFYKGIIRIENPLNSALKGKYKVTVLAKDSGSPALETTTQLEIFTIDTSYRVDLRFTSSADEIRKNIVPITSILAGATGATVHVLDILDQGVKQRVTAISTMSVYFVYQNGTAISPKDIIDVLQSDVQAFQELNKYGLVYVDSGSQKEPESQNVLIGVIAGLNGALIIVMAAMITALVCTSKSYKRKLKAVNALKSINSDKADNLQIGPVVPGTNKYTMECANPVLNLNIDSATDLGFDEESADRVSLNSLDNNDDLNLSEKDSMHLTIIEEEEEEEEEEFTEQPYIEPLDQALALRNKNKGSDETYSFTNPALDTTDL